MLKRVFAASCLALGLAGMTGCAVNRAEGHLMADADLSKVKTLYVVHNEADKHDIDKDLKTLASELTEALEQTVEATEKQLDALQHSIDDLKNAVLGAVKL